MPGTTEIGRCRSLHPSRSACSKDGRAAIEDALERHAERERKRVLLVIEDGRVVLSGSVASWRERETIDEAVRATPGVRVLDNRLRIEPYAI